MKDTLKGLFKRKKDPNREADLTRLRQEIDKACRSEEKRWKEHYEEILKHNEEDYRKEINIQKQTYESKITRLELSIDNLKTEVRNADVIRLTFFEKLKELEKLMNEIDFFVEMYHKSDTRKFQSFSMLKKNVDELKSGTKEYLQLS